MESRPYKRLKSDELESLARREARNMTVLSQIQEEMRHRGTHPAANDVRDLVAELLQSAGSALPATPPTVIRNSGPSSSSRREAPKAVGVNGTPSSPGTSASPRPSIEERYQALRETFTAESEVLARWGMTSLMPQVMRRDVFAAWRDLLARGQHPGEFTIADLETDLRRLEAEHGVTNEDEPDAR